MLKHGSLLPLLCSDGSSTEWLWLGRWEPLSLGGLLSELSISEYESLAEREVELESDSELLDDVGSLVEASLIESLSNSEVLPGYDRDSLIESW